MKIPFLPILAMCGPLLCPTAQAARHTDVEYGVAAGESLRLDAYVPDGAGPFPAVILVHGGGWTTGDKSGGPRQAFIAPLHAPLERAGFAWFSINYRLAPKHRFPACIEDVEAAIRWVKAHAAAHRVDPRRLALSGESAGGHLVALAAARAGAETRVAAVVPFYGVFDLAAMAPAGAPLHKAIANLLGRETPDAPALVLLREASPITHVRPGLPPFLLPHGTGDRTVAFAQSEAFQARLRAVGVSCELLVVPDGAHGMINWNTIMPDYGDRVVAWIARTLGAGGAKSVRP
ncbi:MAG: alpha/beta hydrolase [Opitutaceae bacterium]|nr:alpha/beta hydrolase [Opitutaceae bacterium]